MKDNLKFLFNRAVTILRHKGPVELSRGFIRYLRWKYPFIEVKLRHQYNKINYGNSVANPFKIVYINPQNINRTTSKFATFHHVGCIKGGSWDRNATPVEDHPKYRAVEQHFSEGIPWEETGLFEHYEDVLRTQGQVDGHRSMNELKERYERIDEIFKDIRDNGFKSPSEVSESKLCKKEKLDYPAINIGRDGELIFGVGWHRFTISQVLNLDSIPVRIIARHESWQRKRSQFENGVMSGVYKDHPDLQDIGNPECK